MNILISEVIWPEGVEILENQGHKVTYDKEWYKNRRELLEHLRDADALIVRNQTKVDEELLSHAPNLKVIGRLGVGLDNIERNEAENRGISVISAKNANAVSVAEYVIQAVLSAGRPLHEAHKSVTEGKWERKVHTGFEISGKTLGFIGLGEISHRTAKRAKAFGMNVIGYDPFRTEYDYMIDETGVVKKEWEDVLRTSDFLSIHVPLNAATKNLVDREALQMMKPSAWVINTARGGIVDETALADTLHEGRLAGAFLDVLENEPAQPENLILHAPGVRLTPHIAGLTEESQKRISVMIAAEVNKELQGTPSLCRV
ncbi:hydroxyacid dehydrogenase [Halobacillus kuroshimensis]|uniref:Hydroxyacid dehydrogenase n=1 Tax=Halobacillus kuroshimensis TaxID=302481 RepID=A0ABS3E0L3_9BACI|nr:hydroxyacid dehydrogenase [Halobacillus kuroshimensis]MBN8237126.1 hydroxyacid dehydrogenase [Halobacillus kuroshimensis]